MNLNDLSKKVHEANIKWWQDVATGQPIKRNKGELIALIHSELSEALEGARKGLMDDHLPQFPMEQVELVDAIIRLLDYFGGHHPGCDIQAIFDLKMNYNRRRKDHTPAQRARPGGKQF